MSHSDIRAERCRPLTDRAVLLMAGAAVLLIMAVFANPARASTAYGDLNNFDVVNDTGTDSHGFEIELEDIHSTDITYTYDYNHYGAPTITEDNSDPVHPKVFVRYAAKYNSATNTFSAYTAVPATPPLPTDGHQCTNPSVNFGCEHFGVGHYGAPTVVRYNWLIESPSLPGTLILGPPVNVSTPSWIYYPPIIQPVAQVQAVILAPPPPPAPVYEFGDAVWVKSIVTTSHNNQPVELKDLVSDDPDDPNDKNWANGEPDEVEVEWHILQTEFSNPAGANNELAGGIDDLPGGDEVVTRRYEFYKYTGPLDPESNEAQCDNYPQISDSADPQYKAECDPATVNILGDYIGSQMAGFNVEAVLGLVDHIQDGDLDQLYTTRTVVVGGNTPYLTLVAPGSLPPGLTLDSPTGVLSGTPTAAGVFSFTITATDADAVQVTKAYTMSVNDQADGCPDDPAKTDPGMCGCGVPDTDTDGDGTADCNDLCANDPGKLDPGVCGCGIADVDGDGDGSADCIDSCPNDPAKAAPGICGCGVADTDSDGDGTADCNDLCPNDPAKIAAGVCGCGVADTDSDGDGTANCNDLCPNDPAKIAAGVCGCGVADTDSDGDGTADCNDLCPNDPAKIAAGVCGCGVADTDSDGDGTANCNDLCPNDPAKIAAGVCGCGVADVDGNGNGTVDCLEVGTADLVLRLHSRPRQVKVQKEIKYTLRVKNNGPDGATSVTASLMCSGLPFRLVDASDSCIASGSTITCSIGSLSKGRVDEVEMTIVPEAEGLLHCTATASSATVDPDPTNQTHNVDTRVR